MDSGLFLVGELYQIGERKFDSGNIQYELAIRIKGRDAQGRPVDQYKDVRLNYQQAEAGIQNACRQMIGKTIKAEVYETAYVSKKGAQAQLNLADMPVLVTSVQPAPVRASA